MVKRSAGALAVLLLCASGVARAERPKILVLPVTGKTADAGFRQRVAQALSEGLIASGGDVVAAPSGAAALPPEGCATPACLSGAARATGAVLLLRAVVDEEGRSYTFKLEMLDGQSGAVLAQRENRCEICTDSEALEIANAAASAVKAQALKRQAPVSASGPTAPPAGGGARAAGPERAPGNASGVPGVSTTAANEGEGGSVLTRVLLGAGIAAVGAAGIVTGSFTWQRAGTQTDCFTTMAGTRDCASTYEGRNLGIGMVVGGAILAGVGGYLMIFSGSTTHVAAGPGGVSVAGTF